MTYLATAVKRKRTPTLLICTWCERQYNAYHKSCITCSAECWKHLKDKRISDNIKVTYPDAIECKICGYYVRNSIGLHLNHKHDINVLEYKTRFGMDLNSSEGIVTSSTAAKFSANFAGERNSAYQHGGRLSPFSKQFVKYDGLTEKQKEETIQQCFTDWVVNAPPESRQQNMEYWTAHGFSEEEAKLKVKERQTTFNLEKCIKKFGEEEGLKRWTERQKKWQATLSAKPEEEIERINQLKLYKGGSLSSISQDLFLKIHLEGARWGMKREGNPGEKMLKIGENKRMLMDFTYGDKVIEFFGDYWHANPSKYKSDQLLKLGKGKVLAADKWQSDSDRLGFIENSGYQVLVVWEGDYRKDPKKVIQECLSFLNA